MRVLKVNSDNEFKKGLFWNYISLIFMAAGGFCFSLLIGLFYDAETLGYFNTFYAVYIAFSQIAVFGCQNAVTKYVSEDPDDLMKAKSYLFMALIIVGIIAAIINIFCRVFSLFLAIPLGLTSTEINAMLLGVMMFAINKVILGYLNGLSRMTEYGIFQSFRYTFIAVFIIVFSVLQLDREYLVFCFFCAETLLFIIEIPAIMKYGFTGVNISATGIKEIIIFGYHILPANLVLDLNSKADVLCLSLATRNEKMVGIYSFAVLFAEGFYQLLVVIRRSVNPKITFAFINDKFQEFYEKGNNIIRSIGYIACIACGTIIVIVYRVACVFMNDASYLEGTMSLILVNAAIVLNIRGIIWGNLLSQVGNPKYEAIVNIVTILSNIVMNFIFIHLFGMIGAAIGTAISYFAFTLIQKFYIGKVLKV